MKYDDDPGVLCEKLGRCLQWLWCDRCVRCFCECRCPGYDPFAFRDEYGQGKDPLRRVDTLSPAEGFL